MLYIMRKLLLCSFLVLLCLSGVSTADEPSGTANYPKDSLLISPVSNNIPNDDTLTPVENYTGIRSLAYKVQHNLLETYSYLIGLPSAFISETIAVFFILLGAGACTLLLTRWKLPEDPSSRPRILLNTIREHPGATQSELQKLTGHSRGSVSVNLHHLGMASKIRKSVQNGKTRYYLASTPDDEMKGFLCANSPPRKTRRRSWKQSSATPESPRKNCTKQQEFPRQHSSGISHSLQSMRPSKVRGNETPSTTTSSQTLYSSTTTLSKKQNRTTHLQRKKNQTTTKNHNHISFFQPPFTETLIYANEQHNSTRESHS